MPYRLAALWGGQAGSLLLWLWMLCGYAAAAVWLTRGTHRSLMPWVCAALLGNAVFFLVLLNFVHEPVREAPARRGALRRRRPEPAAPAPGDDDPPAHALLRAHRLLGAVRVRRSRRSRPAQLGTAWLRTTRRWTLVAWLFLSIGILLGGRWAYEVLGWGGYWAWDPVENASFMPWLAATAYLHSVMIQEKRDMLKRLEPGADRAHVLALPVRHVAHAQRRSCSRCTRSRRPSSSASSSSATSRHARVALLRPADRAPARAAQRAAARVGALARGRASCFNNWVFMALLAIVFWGTLFPKISEWLAGQRDPARARQFFNKLAARPRAAACCS